VVYLDQHFPHPPGIGPSKEEHSVSDILRGRRRHSYQPRSVETPQSGSACNFDLRKSIVHVISVGGNMTNRLSLLMVFLIPATVCLAQEGLTVQNKGKQKWPAAEAQKIYLSAWPVVQREFGGNRSAAPTVTLVLGADKNEVWVQRREIRLTKWDRYAFAQGVVCLAFEDLMPVEQRLTLAKRAVIWADTTVDTEQLRK
jgi:hypothetical protein